MVRTIGYLRSLDCEDIRDGLDDLIPATFDQLVEDQGHLTGKEFEQVLNTGEYKADVVILDDARTTRESV